MTGPECRDVLLGVRNLSVHFRLRRGGLFGSRVTLRAVDDISFDVRRGSTLAIVGESGSGKTTTALAVARLIEPSAGQVMLAGHDLSTLDDAGLRRCRAEMQFIFQDPYSSLNPRLRAEDIVREPLRNLAANRQDRTGEGVESLFQAVGLRPEQRRLFPHQFSGGQRQRIGIARALASNPSLIICDEPVSALDVAVQAQILNLLRRLQAERDLTFLFISHDLGVVQYMCDDVAVMYMGKIVELAARRDLFESPRHPYTQSLLSAVPAVDPSRRGLARRALVQGDPSDPVNPPRGCRFASRCPMVRDICRTAEPRLTEVSPGHKVSCFAVAPGSEAVTACSPA
ncbi:MAG: ABC transporter ATP-binding protein [Alphaproteobacteria bacterium]|nr:ABC transporter ATP-binding protein [Alphaproteobacteria bacterium]